MDPRIDFVVKLGGSAVTKKSEFETVNQTNIEKAAKVLFRCWKAGKKFIIVHGAGSFGHHQAKKYGVKQGIQDKHKEPSESNRLISGFCLTRVSVCSLNALITKTLIDEGIPAVAQSGCGVWKTDNDEVVESPCSQIASLVQFGCVPVLHGDCVLDESKGCTILSGDTICEVLCEYFKPSRMIFACDVAGIYSKPPEQPDAILLPEIVLSEDGTTNISVLMNTNAHDVTGGIEFKLKTAIGIILKCRGRIYAFMCEMISQSFESICSCTENADTVSTVIKFKT